MVKRADEYYPCIIYPEFYYFGEVDMLLSSKKLHLTTVFSSEGCELLTLSREKFVQLLEIFEDEAVKLYVLARERLYRTNEKMLEALKEIENRFSVSKTVTIPTLSHFESGSIKDKCRRSSELNIIIQKDSTIKKNLQEKSELDEDVEIMIDKIKNTCKITKKINTLGLKIINHLNKEKSLNNNLIDS